MRELTRFNVCVCVQGTTAHVVVMEEAAFMKPSVVYKVIIPLMAVKDTAILAISTPEDEGNYYSVLLSLLNDDGTTVFKTLAVGLSCDACRAEGKASECSHKSSDLPSWKSEDMQRLQKRVLPKEIYEAEALGLGTQRRSCCPPLSLRAHLLRVCARACSRVDQAILF